MYTNFKVDQMSASLATAAAPAIQTAAAKPQPMLLAQKLQALLNAGAYFTLGQPEYVEIEDDPFKKSKKRQLFQPMVGGKGTAVTDVHDGGAWIGVTFESGIRGRTAKQEDADKLRTMLESCETIAQGQLGDVGVHLDRTCELQTVMH